MNIVKTIGKNIKTQMEKRGVSNRELAKAVGVSHPTLKRYIDGTQPIDSEKLMKVSRFFGLPFESFFKRESQSTLNFMFRADKANENVKDVDLATLSQSIKSYLDVMENQDYYTIPAKYAITVKDRKTLSSQVKNRIESIAYTQRKSLGIENVVPENYFDVFTRLGINTIVRKFNNTEFFGMSSYSEDFGSFIIVNDDESIPEERKIFSLVHEFGHLLFHRSQYAEANEDVFYVSGRSDINEKVANKFAGYFLLPRDQVVEYVNGKENVDVYKMKKHFKVSLQSLAVMLREYKMISQEVSNNFWRTLNANKLKKEEPVPMEPLSFEQKNRRLIEKIKNDYLKGEITPNKVTEILGLNVVETRKLFKKWKDSDERYIHLK